MSCSVERFGPARLYRTLGLSNLLRRSVGRRYLALVTDYDGTIASKRRASAVPRSMRLRAFEHRAADPYWLRPRMLLFSCLRILSSFEDWEVRLVIVLLQFPTRYFLPRRRHAGGRSPNGSTICL